VRNLQSASRPALASGDLDSPINQHAADGFGPSALTRRLDSSSWDLGATGPRCGSRRPNKASARSSLPTLSAAELVQLRSRVIALENLVITLLAEVAPQQLDRARAMAQYISPRPGATAHPLTVHAAAQMVQLVDRADHFRQATI
jgi:hypothetical protein